MRVQALAFVATVFAAGCTTVSDEIAFQDQADRSFVLVAADGMPMNGLTNYSVRLQQLNAERDDTTRQGVSAMFHNPGSLGGNEFAKPAGLTTTLRFAGGETAPGEYLLLYRRQTTTMGALVNTTQSCFTLGTSVFRIEPGKVNVIALNMDLNEQLALTPLVQKLLEAYPNMSAPVTYAPTIGSATFESGQWLGQESCVPSNVVFTPRPADGA